MMALQRMAAVAVGVMALVLAAGCGDGMAHDGQAGASGAGKEVSTPSGLRYEDIQVGTGGEAKTDHLVDVFYTGWLASSGKKFDSNVGKNPLSFRLGAEKVIKGFDEGVTGMKEGGKRKIYIPSALGYGARGAGSVIPPNADLIFEIELVKVR